MKITIVGGGTAGFITALIFNERLNADIEMIVPSNIGIIGVGEGSTKHWSKFLSFIGVTKTECLLQSKGTTKGGINFIGWTPKRGDYAHSISGDYANDKLGDTTYIQTKLMSENISNYEYTGHELRNNVIVDEAETGGWNQFHFNTFALNDFLTELATSRGIKIIDDEITQVHKDENGISKLTGTKDEYISDLYVDCTGFKRLLISELGAKWVSYGKYLPLKEAIAFGTKDSDVYPVLTEARAMSAGWKWLIPTYGRTGNGYIFDTDFISKEQAHDEINFMYGEDIEIAKHIKFDPGKLDKVCIKNCLAVGLSANFLEPLEATSIGTTIQQAFIAMHKIRGDGSISPPDRKLINDITDGIMHNTRDLVALHYINDNRSTPFWRMCADLPRPDSLMSLLESMKYKPLDDHDIVNMYGSGYALFEADNFNLVAYFRQLLRPQICQLQLNGVKPNLKENIWNRKYKESLQHRWLKSKYDLDCTPHKAYIQQLHELNGDYKKIKYTHYIDKKDFKLKEKA
jgi:hypothetical protein